MTLKYSNTERTHIDKNGNATTYKVCDACGSESKSNYGFTLEYDVIGSCAAIRIGLCRKCANKIAPFLEECDYVIMEQVDRIRRSNKND